MPTGQENLAGALALAQSICWDETHGYTTTDQQGVSTGRQLNPDVDCSALVCHCLYTNGFSISEWGDTNTIITTLSSYSGFQHFIFDPNSTQLVHGDILVSEGSGANAHTFFYAENVIGYPSSQNPQTTTLARARIEASSSRGSTLPGDQANQYGVHDEVWVHNYYWHSSDSRVWHLFRWTNGPTPPPTQAWLYSKFLKNRRYKDYDY